MFVVVQLFIKQSLFRVSDFLGKLTIKWIYNDKFQGYLLGGMSKTQYKEVIFSHVLYMTTLSLWCVDFGTVIWHQ